MSILGNTNKTKGIETILFIATENGQVANTVTETTLIGSGSGSLTLPANFFTVNRTLHIIGMGMLSHTTTPVNFQIKIKLGSTIILDTGTKQLSTAHTDLHWDLDADITCRTTGATGTVQGCGDFEFLDNSSNDTTSMFGMTASPVTIDTTASQVLDVTVTWGTQDILNDIRSTNFYVKEFSV